MSFFPPLMFGFALGPAGVSHWVHESQRDELKDLKVLTTNYEAIKNQKQVMVMRGFLVFSFFSTHVFELGLLDAN